MREIVRTSESFLDEDSSMTRMTVVGISLLLSSWAAVAHGQTGLTEPQESPAATVTQTVGLTEVQVKYHRPAVKGRTIWGGLVPYGEVWRAGANENTIVTLSTPVKVQGKTLAAGTYGLHMLPTQKEWTIIFSKVSTAWGSFTYDAKEDALRVTVTPRAAAGMTERLLYRFDDPSETKATLVLAWDKLEVPVALEADTPAIVMTSMRGELRGLPNFFWQGWNQAAQYWANHGGPLDEALRMSDRSIQINPTFANQMTRGLILEKQGKAADAKAARAKAKAMASEQDLNQYGYQLIGQKKMDEAIAVFQDNVKAHPESWNVHDSLGEALAMKGDRAGAIASYTKALSLVKDANQKARIEKTLAQLKSAS
jgi:hypothetical protein